MEKARTLSSPFPDMIRFAIQRKTRMFLLALAGYTVHQEGELPDTPSLLALYPHGEHANSLLLPTEKIAYIAAADYWYGAAIIRALAVSLVGNSIPVDRENGMTPSTHKKLRKKINAGYHIGWYPQGTRAGAASSLQELMHQPEGGGQGVHLQAQGVGLARILKVPMVPVGLIYPEWYQPQKGGPDAWKRVLDRDPRVVNITVRIGEPIEVRKVVSNKRLNSWQLLSLPYRNPDLAGCGTPRASYVRRRVSRIIASGVSGPKKSGAPK